MLRQLPVVLLLAGCHSAPLVDGAPSAPIADMSPIGDLTPAAAAVDGGVAPADLAGAPAPDLGPTHFGSVLLDSDRTVDVVRSYVYPTFADPTDDPGCTTSVAGACTLYLCTDDGTALPLPHYHGAGSITVTGGMRTVTAPPASDGSYAPTDDARALWSGGETLNVQAAGDVVPPFSLSLTAPMPMVVTAPPATGASAIDRQSDLWVAWSGADASVEIALGADGDGTRYGALDCVVPAAPGRYALPSSLLSQLPPGTGTLLVESVSEREITAGAWSIDAFARSIAADETGASFQPTVELR